MNRRQFLLGATLAPLMPAVVRAEAPSAEPVKDLLDRFIQQVIFSAAHDSHVARRRRKIGLAGASRRSLASGARALPCALRAAGSRSRRHRSRPVVARGLGEPSDPSGGAPPIHMPLALEAAILSQMRSAVSSRSNCANESSMLSVCRPKRCHSALVDPRPGHRISARRRDSKSHRSAWTFRSHAPS